MLYTAGILQFLNILGDIFQRDKILGIELMWEQSMGIFSKTPKFRNPNYIVEFFYARFFSEKSNSVHNKMFLFSNKN